MAKHLMKAIPLFILSWIAINFSVRAAVLIPPSSSTNYTFRADTTYLINRVLDFQTTPGNSITFEGGTVIKFSPGASLNVNGPITWLGSAMQPVVLTARDDHSIGDQIGNGALNGYYADTALNLNGPAGTAYNITGLRILYAKDGIVLNRGSSHQFKHLQVCHVQNVISTPGPPFAVRNALVADIESCFVSTAANGAIPSGQIQHLTVNGAMWLNKNQSLSLSYVNCLLVGITNSPPSAGSSSAIVPSSAGVFQNVIGGGHYLANNAYRNAGVTTIDPNLKKDFQRMTTYPPIVVTNNYTRSVMLSPRQIGDTDVPDYGYHYPVADYIWSATHIQGCAVTLTNGVAVALFQPIGVTLESGASLISEGLPTRLNSIFRVEGIQELVPSAGKPTNFIADLGNDQVWPTVSLRFTELFGMAGPGRNVAGNLVSPCWSDFLLRDCQLQNVLLAFWPNTYVPGGPGNASATIQNNVIIGSRLSIYKSYGAADSALAVSVRNNLFRNSALYPVYDNGIVNPDWTVSDNLFDRGSAAPYGGFKEAISYSHNGFFRSTPVPGAANIVLTNLVYAPGKLGNFYYSASSGDAASLIHAGSQAASAAGLFHYTVRPSAAGVPDFREGLESPDTVSIGFHYVAADSDSDLPDTDGDMLPDYLEDADGNGAQSGAETDWRLSDAPYYSGFETLGPSSRRTPLVVSEIMYHPANPNLQFIELHNSDPWELDISNYQLRVNGLLFSTIPSGQKLGARRFLVLAQNPAAIQTAYGISGVLGWNPLFDLNHQSANIQIFNGHGGLVLEVEYSDESPWPVQADGAGHTLVLARPSYGEKDPRAWTASDVIGGSPGASDLEPSIVTEPRRVIMINEFLANPAANATDFIELYNHSSAAVDVSGCYLSDDSADLMKFTIPAGTMIPPHGFLGFKRDTVRSFTFNIAASGGKLFLTNPARTRVIDACAYKNQPIGISLGRYPDGSPEWRALATQSPGGPNGEAAFDPVIITEIMFKPISGNDADQFLELYNRSGTSVSLNGWSFEGVNYKFGSYTLASNSYVVVCKNATNLFAKYPNLNSGNTFQWSSGALKRSGERIRLLRADGTIANEVTYDGSWGKWADGGGSSLELVDLHGDNRRPINWSDSDDRSKAQWTSFSIPASEQIWSLPPKVPNPALRNWLEVFADAAGEFFIDDVALTSGGVNKVINGTFSGGNVSGWSFYGSHRTYQAQSDALLLKPDQRGDTGPNCARADLSGVPSPGAAANISARAKWQRGNPNIVFRGHGGYLELEANLSIPSNLGSPGLPNTVQAANLGPAISDYIHRPALPEANQPIVVSARVLDRDGVYSVKLSYRVDPGSTYSSVTMLDDGTRGDAVAGDRIYSASVPGQPANSTVAFYITATDSAATRATSVAPAGAPAKECLVRFGEPLVGPAFSGAYTLPSYRMWMTAAVRNNWHNLSTGMPRMNKGHQDMTFVYGNQRVIYNAGAAFSGGFYSSGFMDYNRPDDHTCGYELDFPLNQKFLGSDEAVFDWPVWGQKNSPTHRAGQYEQIGLWLAEQFGIQSLRRRFFHLFVNGVHQSSRPLMQKTFWGFPDHNYDWFEASLGAKIYEDIQQPGSDFVSEWFPNDSNGELYKIAEWFEYPGANPDVETTSSDRYWPVIDNYLRKKSVYRFWWEKRANGISMDYTKLYALFDSFLLPRSDEYLQAVYNWETQSEVDIEQWMKVFAFEDCIGNYDCFGNGWKNSYLYKPTQDKWKVLIWDLDASLGDYATWGPSTPTDPPVITAGPLIDAFQFVSPVRRAYWRHLKSQTAAGGPMDNSALTAQIDGRQAAFQADQVKGGELSGAPDSLITANRDAAAIKSWIASRRTILAAKIPMASFAITSAGGSTTQNPFAVQGTAPVDVTRITVSVNGGTDVEYPITWGPTRETNWKTGVRLDPGVSTTLAFKAFNSSGTQIGSSSVTVTYTGAIPYPASGVIINEHMANNTSFLSDPAAVTPYGPWLELHNTTALPFDLSNYGLTDDASNKSKFVFPANTLIPPGGFLLVWVDGQNSPVGGTEIHCNTFSMINPTAGNTASIYLYAPGNGQLVASDSYSTQAQNVSRRRLPNATGSLANGNANSPSTPRRYNR